MPPRKTTKPKEKGQPKIGVLLDERKRKAVNVLAMAGYVRGQKCRSGAITNAARNAGCDRGTIYDWLEDPEFVEAIDEAKEIVRVQAVNGLVKGAAKSNVAACMAILKIIQPELYDEQLRRDEVKRAHEREMFRLNCEHEEKMLRLKIELAEKTADDGDYAIPDIVIRETLPGERFAKDDEDLH